MKNKLHDACERDDINDVIELIKEGVDLNIQNEDQMTVLMYCCSKGRTEIADLLIKSGADITIKGMLGSTPLTIAASCCHGEIIQILLNNGADINEPWGSDSALTLSSMLGFPNIAFYLIIMGANVDFKGVNGKTALMYAVEMGCAELVEVLLEKGADNSITDDEGRTAFDRVSASDSEMMQPFIQSANEWL